MTIKLIVLACLLAIADARFFNNVNFNITTFASRIIGGHNAKEGQFPHQISIQAKFPENGLLYFTHFCGGSILNNQWILTAAHCLVPIETAHPDVVFAIKAGKYDLSSTEDTEQTSFIDKFFIHEYYDRKLNQGVGPYDIGLIRLKKPFRLNKRVAAINLPQKNSEPKGNVTLSGWGAIDSDKINPDMPYTLQTVDLKIIDRVTCNKDVRKLYEEKGLTYNDLVDETNICSEPATGSASACGGDSGGPLISKNTNGETEIVGIVSWGIEPCGTHGAPSVYAQVSFFVDWINKILLNN